MITSLKDLLAEIRKWFTGSKNISSVDVSEPVLPETDVNKNPDADGLFTTEGSLGNEDAFFSIVGLALVILICLIAFVWGANSAKRRMDNSYKLKNSLSSNRQYLTFTQAKNRSETIN